MTLPSGWSSGSSSAGALFPASLAILSVYLLFFGGLFALILHVAPPMVRDIEGLAKKLPTYVTDFENWAENNKQFNELNQKYDLTDKLSEQASSLPSDARQRRRRDRQRHRQPARAPDRRSSRSSR